MRTESCTATFQGMAIVGMLMLCACGGGGSAGGGANQGGNPPATTPPPLLDVVVSPGGSSGNPGTIDAPTTLDHARTIIHGASRTRPGALRVLLRGGVYSRTTTFALDSSDSGTADNPIQYAAYPGETPRLAGGALLSLSPSDFHLVDGSDINWSRLDSNARTKIYVADISAYRSSLGIISSRTANKGAEYNSSIEIFIDGEPLTLARYPKAVDPQSVNLAPSSTVHVGIGAKGMPSPDVTGDYAWNQDSSNPVYRMTKNMWNAKENKWQEVVWTIARRPSSIAWALSNQTDPRTDGYPFANWGTLESFDGPAGNFDATEWVEGNLLHSEAQGSVFISPSDGSRPMPGFMLIQDTDKITQITTAPNSRMANWNPNEAMYYGFYNVGYLAYHNPIAAIGSGSITLTNPALAPGLLVGRPFFIYNLLKELTEPGEYFIDTVHARLYLRPNGDVPPGEVLVSLLQGRIMTMYGAEHISWDGVVFEATKHHLVWVQDSNDITFKNCKFRNSGGWGLVLNGYRNLVDACEFKQHGMGGIWVSGGNRHTLTSAGTVIQNCDIHHFGRLFWTYQNGIQIGSFLDFRYQDDACGITVQHNEIHHAPHGAILFKGNNHLIRYNNIHHVCQWSNDVGAIYTGRDWGLQGNFIQFNLLRENSSPFGYWSPGIYLDSCASGITVEGNILYNDTPHLAIQQNGGRDVIIRYNIMVGHLYGVMTNNAGFSTESINGWGGAGDAGDVLEKINHFHFKTPPWSDSYRNLAKMPNTADEIWGKRTSVNGKDTFPGTHWLEPENSLIDGNLHQGVSADVFRIGNFAPSGSAWDLRWHYNDYMHGNLSQVDPQFVDPDNENIHYGFQLKSTSPMYQFLNALGYDASKIGIQH